MITEFRRWINLIECGQPLLEGKVERVPYTDYIGREIELTLVYDPSAQQARNFIDRSTNKNLRVLVLVNGIVCWDAYYVEHTDIAKMFGQKEDGRYGKLNLVYDDYSAHLSTPVYRFAGSSWYEFRIEYVRIPAIARLLASGFAEPANQTEQSA
jgi:hypothetical protein